MSILKTLAATTLLLTAASTVAAQSLEMRKRLAEQEGELSTLVALTNKKCGIDLKATIDMASFNADEFLQKSAVSWCSAALTALENVCSDAAGKQAVAGAIKTLTCSGGPAVSVGLTNGDLKYAFPFSSASNANEMAIRTYLEKHL
jgi:hypothetical protein